LGGDERSSTIRRIIPLELQIIRAPEFLRVDTREHLDFPASKDALQTLAQGCRKRGVHRALLDLRPLPIPPEPLFTPTELAALVNTFREAGFGRQQRLAVLYREDPHGGVKLLAFISRMRGWQVRAFADFEEALSWLSIDKSKSSESAGDNVPIHFRKR
jgi:hypothetical protein